MLDLEVASETNLQYSPMRRTARTLMQMLPELILFSGIVQFQTMIICLQVSNFDIRFLMINIIQRDL